MYHSYLCSKSKPNMKKWYFEHFKENSCVTFHKNKMKSLKVAKWKKDEWRMNEEWWRMKDDDFKLLRGFDDEQTGICKCRVTFETEK